MDSPSAWLGPSITVGAILGGAIWWLVCRHFEMALREQIRKEVKIDKDELKKDIAEVKEMITNGNTEASHTRGLIYARMGAVETSVARLEGELKNGRQRRQT